MQCKCCNKEITKQNSCSYHGNVYCAKHYQQLLKYGHTLDTNPRSTFDLNDFEFIDEHTVKIITFNRRSEVSGEFLISPQDFERVIAKKWRIWQGRIYTGNYKPITISRFLLADEINKDSNNLVVDHINSNPLDNRRENLRLITQQDNLCNKILLSNNTSSVAGVSFCSARDKWEAEISLGGKRYKLGRWQNFADAVYARYYAEQKIFKDKRSTQNDIHILKIITNCTNKQKIQDYVEKKIVNSTH